MNKEVNVCYKVSVIDACRNGGGDDGDLLSGRGVFRAQEEANRCVFVRAVRRFSSEESKR